MEAEYTPPQEKAKLFSLNRAEERVKRFITAESQRYKDLFTAEAQRRRD